MTRPFFILAATTALALTLTACSGGRLYDTAAVKRELIAKGEFWQRRDATSAIWMQGAKAQQSLNRDLSRCVTELNELVALGQIKSVMPAEPKDLQNAANPAHANLMRWDTPERDGALLVEGAPYLDFETCMASKGWQRVVHVPYNTAERGATGYMNTHRDLKKYAQYRYAPPPTTQDKGKYKNLND